MAGWVKVHRKLLDSPIFQNEKLLKVFMWCLLKTYHKDHEQLIGRQKVPIKAGQFPTGRNKAGRELGMAPSTAWDYLKLLEASGSINIKSNTKYSVVSVVNWSLYQIEGERSDSKPDNKSTTNQQQINTNKNVKNVKNLKIPSSQKQAPTFDEGSMEYKLATKLRDRILGNLPNARVPRATPAGMEGWCKHIDYILRIDKRRPEDVAAVIYWCQSDDFWRANIMSPRKLREKWDTLALQMQRGSNSPARKNSTPRLNYSQQGQGENIYNDLELYRLPPTREG